MCSSSQGQERPRVVTHRRGSRPRLTNEVSPAKVQGQGRECTPAASASRLARRRKPKSCVFAPQAPRGPKTEARPTLTAARAPRKTLREKSRTQSTQLRVVDGPAPPLRACAAPPGSSHCPRLRGIEGWFTTLGVDSRQRGLQGEILDRGDFYLPNPDPEQSDAGDLTRFPSGVPTTASLSPNTGSSAEAWPGGRGPSSHWRLRKRRGGKSSRRGGRCGPAR